MSEEIRQMIQGALLVGANFPSTVQPFIADAISAVIGAFIVCVITWNGADALFGFTKLLHPAAS